MTPTNVRLGELDPARLARLDDRGKWVDGDKPTKETFLHLAMYRERQAGAVVHLHATHSVAVSCLADVDPNDVLPPLTRSEEHTSELQSLMRISYAVFC